MGKAFETFHAGIFHSFPNLGGFKSIVSCGLWSLLQNLAAFSWTQRGVSGCLMSEQWFVFLTFQNIQIRLVTKPFCFQRSIITYSLALSSLVFDLPCLLKRLSQKSRIILIFTKSKSSLLVFVFHDLLWPPFDIIGYLLLLETPMFSFPRHHAYQTASLFHIPVSSSFSYIFWLTALGISSGLVSTF